MKELKGQFVGAMLVVITAAAVISAVINFQEQQRYRLPDDGVTWTEWIKDGKTVVTARHVVEGSGADRAGIKAGDRLLRINNYPIETALDPTRVMVSLKAWAYPDYVFQRNGVDLKAKVMIRERVPHSSLYYQYAVGLCYLSIGLFVYLRRFRAPHATHFYYLCLASFVLSTFHYTGKLDNFDKVMYWGNVAAGLLAPTIFLHFCLSFPEPRRWIRGLRASLLYMPALLFLGVYVGVASGVVLITSASLVELRWALDRGALVFLSCGYLLGALTVNHSFHRATDPIVRQQLKWLRNGAVLGVLPFTCINVVPYLFGVVPGNYMHMAVLTLIFVPITWAYAILRYRLMDVDVIFQQGLAYTMATLAVFGVFYGLILSIGDFDELPVQAVVILMVIATVLFQPLRSWFKEQLDRYYFFKDRYDYRRTLVEFARELGAETDLDAMLHSVAERLHRTLYIKHVAFFLDKEPESGFALAMYSGDRRKLDEHNEGLDLSFLPPGPAVAPVFFEQTPHTFDIVYRDWPASRRRTVASLELTYYLPCSVRGRTIAWLGVSRTDKGDFLSGQDLELLATISGYIGIAVENARLYRSLQLKMAEYERLKEFSENIVESINVGIVAAGLDDRVESWNSQMETLTGIPRERAMGQPLRDIFPPSLVDSIDEVRGAGGIHQLFKIPLSTHPWTAWGRAKTAQNGSAAGAVNGAHPSQPSEPPSEAPSEPRLANIAIAPLVSKDQLQIGRLIIFDDVTQRSQLEQQLIQADKLSSIGLLAAGVAHEVNTPLAVISTYAQMLAKQISADDPKVRLLEKIAKQTFRASEIVNSLLNFSRTHKSEFEELDLNRVLRETLSLVEHQMVKSAVSIEFYSEDNLPAIRGNFGKMQQVFLNLFINARDAMEEGGTLKVITTAQDELACVEVSDTGKGIGAADLPRIYDPFFTTKAARKGTGLGLAVTYGIVREHNGTIEASSKPGTGTSFRLEFPAVHKPAHV